MMHMFFFFSYVTHVFRVFCVKSIKRPVERYWYLVFSCCGQRVQQCFVRQEDGREECLVCVGVQARVRD